jgi:hypothetical protein
MILLRGYYAVRHGYRRRLHAVILQGLESHHLHSIATDSGSNKHAGGGDLCLVPLQCQLGWKLGGNRRRFRSCHLDLEQLVTED